MIEQSVARFGRIDCLINNAGGGTRRGGVPLPPARIDQVDLEDFDMVVGVHVRGVLAAMKYVVPVMAAQGSGSIITVASVNGIRPGLGGHYYAVAKAASIHLTRCAAVELGEKRIRVNTISPGPIATGIFGKALGLSGDAAEKTATKARLANIVQTTVVITLSRLSGPRPAEHH